MEKAGWRRCLKQTLFSEGNVQVKSIEWEASEVDALEVSVVHQLADSPAYGNGVLIAQATGAVG